MNTVIVLECLDCGHRVPFSSTAANCPKCNSTWREARYDLEEIGRTLQGQLTARAFDLWRYKELLPVRNPNQVISLGEGGTPLIHATNLGMMLGCPNIYIKDERQGPTNSFKDRQAAVGVAALKEAGVTEVVVASTGNVAIAYSAYCARAGIKLWAFLTSLVPAEKMREVALYGTQVVKVTASYDQAKQVAAEFARQRNLFLERGSRTIPAIEGMKTIAYEVCEQLTQMLGPVNPNNGTNGNGKPAQWRTPDWYVQSVSGGMGPLGVQKGFDELQKMGWIDHQPAIACIQAEGCAPMVHAFRQGLDVAEPVKSPRTHIATLATGDPGRTYTLLYQRMQQNGGGLFDAVSDEETYRTMHILAKMEGLSVEPAAAVAFAGIIRLIRSGKMKQNDTIVVNCTGHTLPIDSDILGEGWARNVAVPAMQATQPQDIPEEGLLAALNRVTSDRFSSVVIVDDNTDARRLIRRILQSQGNFKLFEATNGKEAIEVSLREVPDLIILDLMMPEVDGFAVLDALKADASTAHIPVIVVTAKELTREEKERLQGQIFALMQKGEFMNDELMDEVKALLK